MATMNGEALRIKAERRGQICVLAIGGRLDLATSTGLAERIAAERANQPARLVLDMSGVAIIDGSGARALVAAARPAPGLCPVIVRSLRPAAGRLLELIGADLGPGAPGPGGAAPGPGGAAPGPGGAAPGPGDTELRARRNAALAASPTGTLVREWRHLHSSTEQVISDSRRTARYLASTEDQVAATLLRVAARRPASSSRLENLSRAARGHAQRMRDQAVLRQDPATAPPRPSPQHRSDAAAGTLGRAIAFIEERARDDIGVTDIAAAAFVSARALQLAFRRHLGTTPAGYLRQVRLEHAHRELVSGDPRHTTVTRIAADWGFPNSSRFTAYYCAAYGVLPGQTLRHRRLAPCTSRSAPVPWPRTAWPPRQPDGAASLRPAWT